MSETHRILAHFVLQLCVGLLFCIRPAPGQSNNVLNYREIFDTHYTQAIQHIRDNRQIIDTLTHYHFDAKFALSIVFPELIRYSALRDAIETANLRVLYIQFGAAYSDFSIGHFQMKPSFVEMLESDYNTMRSKSLRCPFLSSPFMMRSDTECRAARVRRMSNPVWQVKYLMLFICIMDKQCPDRLKYNNIQRLRYYATAYNYGYKKTEGQITAAMQKKHFTLNLTDSGRYNYADIATYFYTHTVIKTN